MDGHQPGVDVGAQSVGAQAFGGRPVVSVSDTALAPSLAQRVATIAVRVAPVDPTPDETAHLLSVR